MGARKIDLERFRVMYERGDSVEKIMKRFGVTSRASVKAARRKLKLDRRSCGWHRLMTAKRWRAIERLIRAGATVDQIRKQVRVCSLTVAAVRRHLKEKDEDARAQKAARAREQRARRDPERTGPYGEQVPPADRWAALV